MRDSRHSRISASPSAAPDQEGAVAVQQAVGLDAAAGALPCPMRRVVERHDAAELDGVAQGRQQALVQARARAGTHRKALGLGQRLHVGLDAAERLGLQQGAELVVEAAEHGRRVPPGRCVPGPQRRRSSSASSSAESETTRGGGWAPAAASGVWPRPCPPVSSGPNTSSTASRRRSAVRRLTSKSR